MTPIEDRIRTTLTTVADTTPVRIPSLDELDQRRRVAQRPARARLRVPRGRRRLVLVLVAGLLLLTAVGVVANQMLQAHEGGLNPGQPLHCSGIELLPPSEAKARLEEMGYEVSWQYHPIPGNSNLLVRRRPPDEGTILNAFVVDGGEVLILAEAYDDNNPMHRRRRAGIPQVEC